MRLSVKRVGEKKLKEGVDQRYLMCSLCHNRDQQLPTIFRLVNDPVFLMREMQMSKWECGELSTGFHGSELLKYRSYEVC